MGKGTTWMATLLVLISIGLGINCCRINSDRLESSSVAGKRLQDEHDYLKVKMETANSIRSFRCRMDKIAHVLKIPKTDCPCSKKEVK